MKKIRQIKILTGCSSVYFDAHGETIVEGILNQKFSRHANPEFSASAIFPKRMMTPWPDLSLDTFIRTSQHGYFSYYLNKKTDAC